MDGERGGVNLSNSGSGKCDNGGNSDRSRERSGGGCMVDQENATAVAAAMDRESAAGAVAAVDRGWNTAGRAATRVPHMQ